MFVAVLRSSDSGLHTGNIADLSGIWSVARLQCEPTDEQVLPKVAQYVEGWKLAGTIKDQPLVLGRNSILYIYYVDKSNVFLSTLT